MNKVVEPVEENLAVHVLISILIKIYEYLSNPGCYVSTVIVQMSREMLRSGMGSFVTCGFILSLR